jgi:hypothetical protein
MLRKFIANYKYKQSSKGFKKVLHILPEGITIIDDATSEFKFINPKLKQTFDVRSYVHTMENVEQLDVIQDKINSEFDDVLAQISNNNSFHDTTSFNFIQEHLSQFTVCKQSESLNDHQSKLFSVDLPSCKLFCIMFMIIPVLQSFRDRYFLMGFSFTLPLQYKIF